MAHTDLTKKASFKRIQDPATKEYVYVPTFEDSAYHKAWLKEANLQALRYIVHNLNIDRKSRHYTTILRALIEK